MFCAECGAKNEDSSRYCENCGALLVSNEVGSDTIPSRILSTQSEETGFNISRSDMRMKISRWTVVVVLQVIVLMILAYGIKWIGDNYYSAEYIAEKYFETIMEGDLGEAYEFLEVKESDFISKETFEKAYRPESRGKLGSYSVKEEQRNSASATVRVTYRVLNESGERTKEIVLLKKADKRLFIFDDWKVNPGEDIVSDVSVYAPQNAVVSLDGIDLGKEYKKSKEDGYDIYQIPEVFCGKHVVSATKENAQSVEKNVAFSSVLDEEEANVVRLPQMYLQKEVLQKISENSKNVFKSIMDAKVKGANAAFIDSVVKDSEGADLTKRYYENFLSVEENYLRIKDILVRAVDNSNEDSYYDFNGFYNEDYPTEAKAEVRANCIYQDAYGYEESQEIFAMFYYGYIDGKLSLLAVELASEW